LTNRKIVFSLAKQAILIRRSIVLSLPVQEGVPEEDEWLARDKLLLENM
jgi:hypothetical protein